MMRFFVLALIVVNLARFGQADELSKLEAGRSLKALALSGVEKLQDIRGQPLKVREGDGTGVQQGELSMQQLETEVSSP